MKILAVDIGAGTEDILLFDSRKRLENCIKLVLPSPSLLLAERVSRQATPGELFVSGHTVGGGPFSRALKKYLASGGRLLMSPAAAYSIRNNLEEVTSMGVELADEPPPAFAGAVMEADELDLGPLTRLLQSAGEGLEDLDAAVVAVQDHGTYARGESNRKTRLRHMQQRLKLSRHTADLSYLEGEVPEAFPRMVSAVRRLREQLSCPHIMVMDTAPAAVAGCLEDPRVGELTEGNLLLVNAGNGHTMACLLGGGKVVGLMEHHTRKLEPAAFAAYLKRFADGEARDDDPFMAEGHGLFYLGEAPGWGDLDLVAVTGPHRGMMEGTGLDVFYPAPGGDMMMTGPLGLVRTLRERLPA